MYHRVANTAGDPWQLTVNPDNFEGQLAMLKQNFNIISVSELQLRLENKNLLENCICLTFDDAYEDNFLNATPLLEKYNCPATFFIPTNFINSTKTFWWDELEEIILRMPCLPIELSLSINGKIAAFKLQNAILTKKEIEVQNAWSYNEIPPTERCRLYLDICILFRSLTQNEIQYYLRQIKKWAGIKQEQMGGGAMKDFQLAELSRNFLFSFGIHTCSHLDLNYHSLLVQQKEIIDCANHLNCKYKNFVNVIAYPFGSYNDTTLKVVKKQNILLGFTTHYELIDKHSKIHELGRLAVPNISGNDLYIQLRKLFNNNKSISLG